MTRHCLALSAFSALALVALAGAPVAFLISLQGEHLMATAAFVGSMICFGIMLQAATDAARRIVREKTRRDFINN